MIGLLASACILVSCTSTPPVGSIQRNKEAVPFRVKTFGPDEVKLLDGPFKHAMELDMKVLLNYEPDRMLSKFNKEAGLTPKAEHYHGWEDGTIAGHTLGHYLSACALMYKSTGDKRSLDRVNYIVNELAIVQDANDKKLFVAQYIASELDWKDKGLKLTQRTDYPEEQGTTLEFECKEPVKLNLQIRYPYWAKNGMIVKVNGRKINVKTKPSSFVPVYRTWKNGDKVEVSFPFSLRLEAMPDDSTRVAIMYGPLVLARELGPVDNPDTASPMFVPVIMSESRIPSDWLSPVEAKANTFQMKGVGKPKDVELMPFYAVHDIRYSIFWDIFTQDAWDKRQKEYKNELARKAAVDARTIDFIQPGEMQPERKHNFNIPLLQT